MKYGSVCSGVEAATVAWEPLGWKPQWFCEFEKFPSAVLAHHYPDVPNLGDMTKIEEKDEYNDRSIDLLVGGTPCQSFSIAGLRKGLDDDRGNLALKFCQILRDKQPRWFIWENVPGVLSSNEGRDFAAILSGFSECGYGFSYRILDAQYFGVPQRRRRVFVVGYLGDWRPAASVLFEQESLHGNPPPRRKKEQRVAPTVTSGPPFSRTGNERVECEAIVIDRAAFNQGKNALYEPMIAESETMPSLVARGPHAVAHRRDIPCSETVGALTDGAHNGGGLNGQDAYTGRILPVIHGTQDPDVLYDKAHTLGRNHGQENAVCIPIHDKATRFGGNKDTERQDGAGNGLGIGKENDPAYTVTAGDKNAVYLDMAVRRLTPVECERLQGFKDNHTQIPWRGKKAEDCPDGPRYKTMGNSMARPVMLWLGERINMFENLTKNGE